MTRRTLEGVRCSEIFFHCSLNGSLTTNDFIFEFVYTVRVSTYAYVVTLGLPTSRSKYNLVHTQQHCARSQCCL